MAKKLRIIMACGAGLGSSFACQMSVEDVLKEMGIEADLDHSDISTAPSMKPDILITAENFKTQFEKFNIDEKVTTMVYLRNLVDKVEIRAKIIPIINEKLENK